MDGRGLIVQKEHVQQHVAYCLVEGCEELHSHTEEMDIESEIEGETYEITVFAPLCRLHKKVANEEQLDDFEKTMVT